MYDSFFLNIIQEKRMKVTALLTGRGNNTLEDKNILDILGHPVLYYPAHAGKMAKTVDSWYCSSDDKKILDAASEEGYKPIIRPSELALPTAQHIDCIRHALRVMEDEAREYIETIRNDYKDATHVCTAYSCCAIGE